MKGAYVLLLLVALAAPGFAQAPDDKLIVPGQRVGKWTLEMTIDDLLRMNGPRNAGGGRQALGHPSGADVLDDTWAHRWDSLGLVAMTIGRDSQSVVELVMRYDEHKTDKGIRVGSSKEAVLSAYGQPTIVTAPLRNWWTGLYDQIGLAVGTENNVAQYVSVFRPGTAKQCYKF